MSRPYNYFFLITISLLLYVSSAYAGMTITGFSDHPIHIIPDNSTGLDEIIVVSSVTNLTITYESSGQGDLEWLQYSVLGGGYSEKVNGIKKSGNLFSLTNPQGNRGYILKDNDTSYAFWLVDYSQYYLKLETLSVNQEESGCDATLLNFSGVASPIEYYTINGKREILSRDIALKYTTLQWDDTNRRFEELNVDKTLASVGDMITVSPAVLCSTSFTMTGDRFLEEWEKGTQTISSDTYFPISVAAETSMVADRDNEQPDNQIGAGNSESGGSAPYHVEFFSYVSDAVIHFEWQFADDAGFQNITNRFYEQDINYSFMDEGTTYIRFIGSNAEGTCVVESEAYTVTIGASELLIPNAFTPNGDGVNDIWKVAYRSLIEFKCWIFDKNGHQIFYFDNPENGWDGKNGTKFVKPGVYFYVIEARGSDGKRYKKSGDINILNSKNY